MRATAPILIIILAGAALAGCSDSGEKDTDDFGTDNLGLVATEETGIIRGVIVDAAVRPVTGVDITVRGPDNEDLLAASDDDGLFGFQDLTPGEYYITAKKLGYVNAQSTTQVVAGISDPKPVKLLLEVDATTLPYVQAYKFDGFIECSESFVAAGHATCGAVPGSNDHFMEEYVLDRPPTFAQSEMIWESSQSLSTELNVLWSRSLPSQTLLDNWEEAGGVSPLVVQANETRINEVGLGSNITLMIRVFNQHNEGTAPEDHANDPTDGDECYDRPQLGGCLRGVGVTVQQQFTVFTHVFYGYTPPEGWLFHVDGDPPAPA